MTATSTKAPTADEIAKRLIEQGPDGLEVPENITLGIITETIPLLFSDCLQNFTFSFNSTITELVNFCPEPGLLPGISFFN